MPAGNDARSLRPAFARIAGGAAGLLGTHLELAALELARARERLLLRLALLVGGVLALGTGAFGCAAFVIVLFWESGRLAALLGVAAGFFVLGTILLVLVVRLGRREGHLFEATLAELRKDADLLHEVLAGQRGTGTGQ